LFDRFLKAGDLHGLVGQFNHPDDFVWTLRTHLLQVLDRKQQSDRDARLRAMFADHRPFINDRLARFVGRRAELGELKNLISARIASGCRNASTSSCRATRERKQLRMAIRSETRTDIIVEKRIHGRAGTSTLATRTGFSVRHNDQLSETVH
jgi:hypothetical protein